jgi:dCMP deaminase
MDKWDSRFMEMAHVIAGWTSCYRPGRSIGCVIVKDKRIMTTGYNGAPAGLKTCRERGECMRDRLGIQSGTRAELCYAIHAEQNAIIQAAKLGVSIDGATLYCTHQPCSVCAKMIINAGIRRVVYQEGYLSRWIFLRKRRFNWSASTRKTRWKLTRKVKNIPSDFGQAGCFRIHFSSGFGSFPTHQPRSLLTLRSTASRLSFHGSA